MSNEGKEPISLGMARVITESHMAVLVKFEESPSTRKKNAKIKKDDEMWIPQKVIHDNSEVWASGQRGKIVVELWWAESRGFA